MILVRNSQVTEYAIRIGIAPKVSAGEAHWQNGMVERHGGVCKEILEATVEECQLRGAEEMAEGALWAHSSKNRGVGKTGYSARTRVFGRQERFCGSVCEALEGNENPAELESLLADPVVKR